MPENTNSNNPIFYPLSSSEEINGGGQTREEFLDVWQRFDQLPEDKKAVLSSPAMAAKIQELQRRFNIGNAETEAISICIRRYYFGQFDWAGITAAVTDILESFPEAAQKGVLAFLKDEVFTLTPPKEAVLPVEEPLPVVPASQIVALPLLQAMSKYQGIGNQMLSAERIRIKTQLEPVRGSLFNWLKYYRDELGIGQHSSVDRGQFLFRSENGRKLNPEEREKLNLLLKSLEENLPLSVDVSRQEIVFPKFEHERVPSQGSPVQPQGQASRPQAAPAPQAGGSFIFQKGPRFGEESKPAAPQAANPFVNGKMNVGKTPSAESSQQPAKAPGSMSFSFNHVLPAEQESPARPAPANATRPTLPKIPPMAPRKMNRFRIRPVSLSQEEENAE